MLGVGIFLNPRLVAAEVSSLPAFFAMWLLGGLVAFAGAAAFAEMGAMFPQTGGEYVFLRRAFGPSVSMAAGWTIAVIVFPGSIAAMAVAVAEYQLLPLLKGAGVTLPGILDTPRELAYLTVFLFSLLNIAGARFSARAQAVLTMTPVFFFAAIAIAGSGTVPQATSAVAHASDSGFMGGFSAAFVAVYFAYSGWNAVVYVAGEVERPRRNVPLALLVGTLSVTVLYALLCIFFVRTLGLAGVAEAHEAGSAAAVAAFGEGATVPITALIAIAILASINGTVMGGARVSWAMAKDRVLPEPAGRLNSLGVPHVALWLQAGVAVVLIATGGFEELLQLTSVTMLIIGAAAVLALFKFRHSDPDRERPFRTPLYPVLPATYVVLSSFVIAYLMWDAASKVASGGEHAQQAVYILIGAIGFVAAVAGHSVWSRFRRSAGA